MGDDRYDASTLFVEQGTLRRLKTFVISQPPVIEVNIRNFNHSEMQLKKYFRKNRKVNLELLGNHNIGNKCSTYTVSECEENIPSQTAKIIFESEITDILRSAFIIGGVAESY